MIAPIVHEINRARSVSAGGRVSLEGYYSDEIISVLATFLRSGNRATDAFKRRLIEKTLASGELKEGFDPQGFIEHAKIVSGHLQRGRSKYVVVFPVLNSPKNFIHRVKLLDVNLNFDPSMKSRLMKNTLSERLRIKENFRGKLKISERYLRECDLILATCCAISEQDALHISEKAVKAGLGAACLALNEGKSSRISSSRPSPMNEILIAPFVTAHGPTGDISYNGYWYYSWDDLIQLTRLKQSGRDRLDKSFHRILDASRSSLWNDKALGALARYFDAFSNFQMEDAFLDGWRLLEYVGGKPHTGSETLVARAAAIFSDGDFYQTIGTHLADRRNRISHGRTLALQDEEVLAFQMAEFVRPLLLMYLMNPFKFGTPSEIWDFLDLPRERSTRETLEANLSRMKKFRGED